MNEENYTETMMGLWDKAPEPFNPEYRQYASQMLFDICDEFEELGYYEIYSREEMSKMIKEEYSKRMVEAEAVYKPRLNALMTQEDPFID